MATDINTQATATTRDTGPLQRVGDFISSVTGMGKGKPAASTAPIHDKRSAMERMRDTVESFDEDYKNIGDRLLGVFMQIVGYLGPFGIVIAVGYDLGLFFAPIYGTLSAMLAAYILESVIAGCTIAMGRAFEEYASGKVKPGKVAITVGIWLVLNASSAVALYFQAAEHFSGQNATTMLILRVSAIALADFGCSIILMWKGRSLQKHIDGIRKKAAAISELADAQRSIEESDKNALMRDQQMQALLKAQEDLTSKISLAMSMMMNEVISQLEQSMKGSREGRHGRF